MNGAVLAALLIVALMGALAWAAYTLYRERQRQQRLM